MQNKKREKRKCVFLFILSILGKILVIALITIFAVFLEKKYESNIPAYVCATIDLITLITFIVSTIKNSKGKYFQNNCSQY